MDHSPDNAVISPSITRRLTASLIVTVVIVSVIAVGAMYVAISQDSSAALERKANETIAYLVGTLDVPLWSVDDNAIKTIGVAVSNDESIVRLIIKTESGAVVYSREKEPGGDLTNRSAPIFHKQGNRQELAGEVSVSLTNEVQKASNRQLVYFLMLILFVVPISLVIATVVSIRTSLRNPLASLNEIANRFASGRYDIKGQPFLYVEFQPFGRALTEMAEKIEGQIRTIQQAEARYRDIFENATEGIFQSTMEGQFLSGNRALAGILGYRSSEELLSSVGDIASNLYVDPAQRDRLLSLLLEQVIVNGFEAQLRCKDGRAIWVSVSARLVRGEAGTPLFIEGFLTDITDRKQSEQALQESRQRLDNIVANSPGAIYRCINDSEWTMEFLSAAITRITGYPADDFLQNRVRSYASIIHPDDRQAVEDAVSTALPHKDRYEMDYRLIATDGSTRWVHEQGQGVFTSDGRLLCLDGVIYDITDQRAAEEEIRKLNQELEHRVAERTAELLAANKELEAFAYSVSHDLRAPLRHIDGFLDLLKARTAATLDDKSLHYMDTISGAARRMGTLIDDLLTFSRMGRNEMAAASVDLGALLQEVIHEFDAETRGRTIDWRIGALPVVTGDRAMLRMVLVNLLSNALKFTKNREQTEIEIGSQSGPETVVFVRDNGAGFDMRYADKLFGVFQRLHASDEFEGTGIGLANVRRIITRHGGKTWAQGKVDGGATFYFSIPSRALPQKVVA